MERYKEVVTAVALTLLSVFLVYKITVGLQPYLVLQSEIVKVLNAQDTRLQKLEEKLNTKLK